MRGRRSGNLPGAESEPGEVAGAPRARSRRPRPPRGDRLDQATRPSGARELARLPAAPRTLSLGRQGGFRKK